MGDGGSIVVRRALQAVALALAFVLLLRQRLRRAWRAVWWALAGFVNLRWRCQLCQRRALRGSSAFCRRCCLAGLGFADDDEDGDDVDVGAT